MKSKSLAEGLLKSLNSFEFIVIMFMMKKIFNFTTPLSNYLQSSKLDFVEAMKLVRATRNELFYLRNLGREQNSLNVLLMKQKLSERNLNKMKEIGNGNVLVKKKKWMENFQMMKDQIQQKTILKVKFIMLHWLKQS